MTNKAVFSNEDVKNIRRQWQENDEATSVADLIQIAGQAALEKSTLQMQRLIDDAELGRIAMRYVDRAGDHCKEDPAEKICDELAAELGDTIDRQCAKRGMPSEKYDANGNLRKPTAHKRASMTNKTVLSEETRQEMIRLLINGGRPIEWLIDRVEQTVLQSPEIQQRLFWQPIETAPKDGTWVRLWRNPGSIGKASPEIIAVYNAPTEYVSDGVWMWPTELYDPYTERGRQLALEDINNGDFYEDDSFLHWMSLPELPVDAAMELEP